MRIVLVILLAFSANAVAQTRPKVAVTKEQAIALDSELRRALNPELRENNYFPPFVAERLKWVEQQIRDRKLARYTVLRSDRGFRLGVALHEVTPGHKIPALYVFLYELVLFAVNYTGGLRVTEIVKNTYAVGYVHESIHLEPEAKPLSLGMDIEDERRAWLKTAKMAINPFIRAKRPLDKDLVKLDQIASKCKYISPCPGLEEWLARYR